MKIEDTKTGADVDLAALDAMFAGIPQGPYSADKRGDGWEVRAIDTDPTNRHHWPYRLCESIRGQKAGCDPAVFGFIAGVINGWPSIRAGIKLLQLRERIVPAQGDAAASVAAMVDEWYRDPAVEKPPAIPASLIERRLRRFVPAQGDEVARLREALKLHHDWHMAQEEAPDGTGGADAYVESMMCDATIAALATQHADLMDHWLLANGHVSERAEMKATIDTLIAERDRALALAAEKQEPVATAKCCHCGRIVDTREKSEGGDDFGAELDDGRWTCSAECWELVVRADEATMMGAAPPSSDT